MAISEYRDWMAFFALEPDKEDTIIAMLAQLTAVMVNIARGVAGDKSSKPAKTEDFMPRTDEDAGDNAAKFLAQTMMMFPDPERKDKPK